MKELSYSSTPEPTHGKVAVDPCEYPKWSGFPPPHPSTSGVMEQNVDPTNTDKSREMRDGSAANTSHITCPSLLFTHLLLH